MLNDDKGDGAADAKWNDLVYSLLMLVCFVLFSLLFPLYIIHSLSACDC